MESYTGYLLKHFRELQNLSLRDLAKKAKCSAMYACQLEKGDKLPYKNSEILHSICNVLKLNYDTIHEMCVLENLLHQVINENSKTLYTVKVILKNKLDWCIETQTLGTGI